MQRSTVTRSIAAAAGLGAAALVAASWGDAGRADDSTPLSGPAVALYVVDHAGAQPEAAALAPYGRAFDRVLAGCRVGPADLASVVFQTSDRATLGSGIEIDNLAVLRGLEREIGPSRVDCNAAFARAESRLEGSAFR